MSLPHRLALALAAALAAAPASAQAPFELDPDGPRKKPFTSQDVRRWTRVGAAELACPDPEFRRIAEQVAAGTTDLRTLRAWARLEPRLHPYDFALTGEHFRRANEQMERMRARPSAALPDPGCWVPIGPRNIPGRMTGIDFHPSDPNTVVASGADGGLWRTTDLGQTWTPLTDFEQVLSTGAVAFDPVDPNVIYVGTGEGNYSGDARRGFGLLRSADGGSTWTMVPVGTLATTWFHVVAVDPDDNRSVWAATTSGLFHSTDGGLSFVPAGNGLPAEDATDFVISAKPGSNVLVAAIGSNTANNGVWRSPDGGASWAAATSIPQGGTNGRIVLAQSRSNPDRWYAAVADRSNSRTKSMWRSDDEGATWTQIPTAGGANGFCSQQCWYDMTLAVDAADPDLVYAGGLDVWRSSDAGQTWSRISRWSAAPEASNYAHADHHDSWSPRADEIWVANDGGVSRSTDRGSTWTLVGKTLETAQYYHITTDPGDDAYAIVGAQDNGTQRFSGSYSWQEVIGGDGFFTAINWNDPRTWYGSLYYVTLFRSRDRGLSWVEIGTDIPSSETRPFLTRLFLDRSNPDNVFALTQRPWKSTDGGDTFAEISGGTTMTSRYLTALDTCRDDGSTIYVGERDGKLWVTRDGGASWIDRTAGLPNRFVTSVSVHPSDPLVAYVTVSGYTSGQHIYRTADAGQTWADVSAALPDIHFSQVLVLEDVPTTIVAASDIGVFWSADEGQTWGVLGSELPNVAVDWLSYSPATGTLRAGTHGRGAWQLVTPNSCALIPDFSGLASVAIVDDGGPCVPELSWAAGTSNCPLAPGLSYNVYRSTDPMFVPGPATLLQAGVTTTSFRDRTAAPGTAYTYVVRAEDGQTGGPGPANGGQEDRNDVRMWVQTGDPFAAGGLADDGGDTSAWLGSRGWSISDGANSTPLGRLSYRNAPARAQTYYADVCSAIETPELVPGPGAALRYQASYNIEDEWDGVVVEISTDGGQSWSDLPPVGGYPRTLAQTQGNACGWPATRACFSGPPGNPGLTGFAPFTHDLSAFSGQTVRIRWRFSSDAGAEFEGFYLDDVTVDPAGPSPGACKGCVAGAPDLRPRSLRMGRDARRDVLAYWTSLDVTGRWNLHATPDATRLGSLWSDMATSIAGATIKQLTLAWSAAPYGFFQVHAADGCTGDSVP